MSEIPLNFEAFKNEMESIDAAEWSNIRRSYRAYRIRMKYGYNILQRTCYRILFGLAAVPLYVVFSLKKAPPRQNGIDTVYYCISHNPGIIPEAFQDASHRVDVRLGSGLYLDKTARRLIQRCFTEGHFNFCFAYEMIAVLANYSYIVHRYRPKTILTTYESSCGAAVLTEYCHQNGITHINFMHGEKFYSPHNTLAAFDEMYVWDEHYLGLFKKLKFSVGRYRVENPWEKLNLPGRLTKIDYVFYLNYESNETLKRIVEAARLLQSMGASVRIRPHPRQLSRRITKKSVPEGMLENPLDKQIFQSIADAESLISRYSTVLYQGYICGKDVIIDDLSCDDDFFINKDKSDYIMLYKPHKMLSEILSDACPKAANKGDKV